MHEGDPKDDGSKARESFSIATWSIAPTYLIRINLCQSHVENDYDVVNIPHLSPDIFSPSLPPTSAIRLARETSSL